jgi:membrane protein DedA with SNARE-associated domain
MELAQPLMTFLTAHVHLAVFLASAIEATGVPFPGRIVLIVAGTFLATGFELGAAVVAATVGSVLGDHVLYVGGRRGGASLLSLYCRLTLASERCVENTVTYFIRFGPPAIMLARFSTGVRLFAAILSGCGHMRYAEFLAYDVAGTIVYATLWVVVGHVFGDHVIAVLAWLGRRRALMLVVPVAVVAVLAYRLWRRRRHGSAQPDTARRLERTAA